MNSVVKLLSEESKVAFIDGKIYDGAEAVGGLLVQAIEIAFAKGVGRGLKVGFVGGVVATGCGVIAYRRYVKPKRKEVEA